MLARDKVNNVAQDMSSRVESVCIFTNTNISRYYVDVLPRVLYQPEYWLCNFRMAPDFRESKFQQLAKYHSLRMIFDGDDIL